MVRCEVGADSPWVVVVDDDVDEEEVSPRPIARSRAARQSIIERSPVVGVTVTVLVPDEAGTVVAEE